MQIFFSLTKCDIILAVIEMKIIEKTYQNEIIIEKSRFITTAFQVNSIDEATQIINQTKKKYWDATHNCSALIIGENQEFMKSSDDGEPSGTAGVPILETIKKSNITNTLVIVTRYFGGIKLGAGGLVRAYSKSASECFKIATFIEKRKLKHYSLDLTYSDYNKVIDLIKNNTHFIEVLYSDKITIHFATNNIEDLTISIQNIINKEIMPVYIDTIIIDVQI